MKDSASPISSNTSSTSGPKLGSGLGLSSSVGSLGMDPLAPAPTPTPTTTPTPPPQPQPQPQRRSARPASADFLSDRATAALIRRTLCAQQIAPGDRGRNTPAPIHDLLPPLTSRNDVDLQLYALISIIIREFVQTWYSKITPDETFVAEIVQIIAHCTRALEQRLRKVDLESLLFDELPELLDAHVRAYRAARNSPARPPIEANPHEIYHSLCPLPALSPVPKPDDPRTIQAQADNERAYRQLLVQGVLAILLPTEDLENTCLTALVGEILSELVIGNLLANRVSEPWLIWEGLIILTRLAHKRDAVEPSSLDASQIDPLLGSNHIHQTSGGRTWSIHQLFWSLVHWGFLAVHMIRLGFGAIMLSRSLPPRSNSNTRQADSLASSYTGKSYDPPTNFEPHPGFVKAPIASFNIWSCLANLIEIDVRMPWLASALSWGQWAAMRGPGKLAGFNGGLDRLLSYYIHTRILDPAHLPPLLRSIRAAVFPNNAPGAPGLIPPSSDEELKALRRRCAKAFWALVPKGVGRSFYGSSSAWPWPSTTIPQPGSSSSSSSSHKSSNNSEASTSVRLGPLASGESSNTDRNVSSTGGEGPCDPAAPAHPRYEDKLPVVDEKREGLESPPPSSVIRKQRPALGATGERSAETGGTDCEEDAAPSCDNDVANVDAVGVRVDEDEDEGRILSEIESGILDVFSDAYCNKHLMYGILELILVRLVPELAEKGVMELWAERLN